MKKSILFFFASLVILFFIGSCQKNEYQADNNNIQLSENTLVGTVWRIQNSQINNEATDVFSFQNQLEIKFLAGGKGMVNYLNKELGSDSNFEWEIKNMGNALVIKENQKITVLEVLTFQNKNLTYSFKQGEKKYQFSLQKM
jgi:predicted secreted protein